MKRIDVVVRNLWDRLKAREKVHVHRQLVEHPGDRPDLFQAAPGFPDGQTCDWVWRLGNGGGRIHAQCFTLEDGTETIRIHHDRWDPDDGAVEFVLHGLFETPVGPALAIGAAGVLVVAAVAKGR